MTSEEFERLYDQIDKRFAEKYVKKDDCNRNIDAEDKKIERLNNTITGLKVDIAKLSTKLGILIAIASAIAVPVISLSIKLLFGG